MNIPPGAAQSFVFSLMPISPIAPTDVQFSFDCSNTNPAPVNTGLNTLLFSASTTLVPDIVALAATTTNDGIVNVPGTNGTEAFALATVNVGASGSITASADTGSATLPVNISLCQTNPANGRCISAIGSSVATTINANGTATFGIFVQGSGNVPFDPAANRIFVRFQEAGGVTRGSTSVAVRTETGLEAFAGTYTGTFSGDDSGTFTCVVDSAGHITGSGVSLQDGPFRGTGTVNSSGEVKFVAGSTTLGSTFSGTISAAGEISGTWENRFFGQTGTFSGRRQ